MPKNDNKKSGNISLLADNVRKLLSGVYRNTYYSNDSNKKIFDNISKDIDNSINDIINKNIDVNGMNMSRVYTRINKEISKDNKDLHDSIDQVFNDQKMMDSLLSTYMENKYTKDLDLEIDTICKYVPKLEDALDVKKDATLSSDIFTKDFLNIMNITDTDNTEQFSSDMEELKNIYKLSNIIETSYENASKYGEQFIYILPYNKAFNDLLKNSNDYNNSDKIIVSESGIKMNGDTIDSEINTNFEGSIEVEFNTSHIPISIINEEKAINKKVSPIIDSDKLEFPDEDYTPDGITNNKKKNQSSIDVNGCIIRQLKRENVIPMYIDEVCLGYYYVESEYDNMFEYVESLHDPLNSLKKGTLDMNKENNNRDLMLRNISSKLSKYIDEKFINNNQDIKKEIYLILKHNDSVNKGNANKFKVTFIPPDNMIHFAFKKDPRTHRGISDLARSLFPAKLYACLYISNTIGILTRSQDKRAYFVKQYVDTNISQLLINTINQIKKSNFGMREINNLNNMLNITGRYNDYVIPVSQSGERPIDFEIISGQDIDTKPDLMDSLETMAINPIGVPIELIDNSRSIDFARQLTTSNIKFARHILNRQAITQEFINQLVTKVHNYHYNKNDMLECILPPPSYLTISNTTELMRNAKDLVDGISELEVSDMDRDEPWVIKFKGNLMRHYLSSYINWGTISKYKKSAKIEAARELKKDDDSGY